MATTLPVNNDAIHFTATSKMAPRLIEQRIDGHLVRAIKRDGLIRLNNVMATLPPSHRICEKILVILAITNSIVVRNIDNIQSVRRLLIELEKISAQLSSSNHMLAKDMLVTKLTELKMAVKVLEQLAHPINANNKHLKYIIRIHSIPTVYKRTDGALFNLRNLLEQNIGWFEDTTLLLQDMHNTIRLLVLKIYANLN